MDSKLKELLENPNKYPDFENLSYWQTRFDNAIAIAVFFAWIKVNFFFLFFFIHLNNLFISDIRKAQWYSS